MKKETIEKSNQILKDKESIDTVINELITGGDFNKKGYRYLTEITIRTHEINVQRRYTEIPISIDGKITLNSPISENDRVVLAYLVKSFHDSVLKLFIARAEELQKEFDNLKDE